MSLLLVLATYFQDGPFECRENFFREETFNSCVPICPTWRQGSEATSIIIDVVIGVSYTIIAIAIIIISIMRRGIM